MTKEGHFKENAEIAIGATGAVVAADQLLKATDPDEEKTNHLLKAGIGAAVAIGAWELLRRAEEEEGHRARSLSPHSRSRSRSRSHSRHGKHHGRHVFEEIIGAYALGKEMLGERKHHVAHLVGEALGATGLIQELRAKDKEEERHEKRHEEHYYK